MKLGDSFPDALNRDLFDERFIPGQVIRLFCFFTKPPKEKLLLVVSVDPVPMFLIINSRIADFLLKLPELANCQIKIRAADHAFLDHDSFINCTEAIAYLTMEEIADQVLADVTRLQGTVVDSVIAEVVKAVNVTRGISLRHKMQILKSLRANP